MKNRSLVLIGDINLKGCTSGQKLFEDVKPRLADAEMVFANLECCFFSPDEGADERRGYYVSPDLGSILAETGAHVVGTANNVTIGRRAIPASIDRLSELGIAQVGSGHDKVQAADHVVLERDRLRYGFLQRTAVFWPDNHVATDKAPGVATIKGHSSYRVQIERQAVRTRPGVPPEVLTWADEASLKSFRSDVRKLKEQSDIAVVSLHWGYRRDILQYQREFAHAAIESGADIVFGHGPHMILPIELYKGRPIIYGGGNFSFQMEHNDVPHTNWIGMITRVELSGSKLAAMTFSFTRRNERNETVGLYGPERDRQRDMLIADSAPLNCKLRADGDLVRLEFSEQD